MSWESYVKSAKNCKSVTENNGEDFLVYRDGSGDTVEIYEIQVNSQRRVGIGRRLVNRLFLHLSKVPNPPKTVFAITRSSNLVAIQFYTELKFRSILLPNFYKDEPLVNGKDYVDAIMFVRDIGSQA